MQGRLVNTEKKNAIQYFPDKNWKKEILIAEKNKFLLMEWTINIENINKNFIAKNNMKKIDVLFFQKSKLSIKSVTCDFFMQKPYFKKKFTKYKDQIFKVICNLIKNCEKLNIKYLIFPLVDNSSIENSEEEITLINEVKKFEKYLNNSEILFEIDYPPKKIFKFIKNFNIKKFGINYDTGNSASLGFDIEDEIKYFKFVKNIHIKDRHYKGESVRLGCGDFQFNKFFKLLRKTQYKGNFILQTARSKKNWHLAEMKKNLSFLNKFI